MFTMVLTTGMSPQKKEVEMARLVCPKCGVSTMQMKTVKCSLDRSDIVKNGRVIVPRWATDTSFECPCGEKLKFKDMLKGEM